MTDLGLLALTLRCYADRRRICDLVLGEYRLELTRALQNRDADEVFRVAVCIAEAAEIARELNIEREAKELETTAAAVHAGGDIEEEDMLAAGLRVMDRLIRRSTRPAREGPNAISLS